MPLSWKVDDSILEHALVSGNRFRGASQAPTSQSGPLADSNSDVSSGMRTNTLPLASMIPFLTRASKRSLGGLFRRASIRLRSLGVKGSRSIFPVSSRVEVGTEDPQYAISVDDGDLDVRLALDHRTFESRLAFKERATNRLKSLRFLVAVPIEVRHFIDDHAVEFVALLLSRRRTLGIWEPLAIIEKADDSLRQRRKALRRRLTFPDQKT